MSGVDVYEANIERIETPPGELQRWRVSVTLNDGFTWKKEGPRVARLIRGVAADVLRDTLMDVIPALDSAWVLVEEREAIE